MFVRRVPTARALDWLVQGFALFRRNPLAWGGSFVLFVTVSLVVSLLPVVGPFTSTLLQPVLLAGLLAGCRDSERGGVLTVSCLFSGWRDRTMPLLVLGLVLALAAFALALLMFAPFGALLGLGYFGSALEETPEWPEELPADLDPAAVWATLAVLALGLLLGIPLAMAGWFAPALVMLENLGVADALKLSFVGCLRNVAPLTVYGLVVMLGVMLAMLPFGLGLLVAIPVWVCSLYASYRDVFDATGQD